MEWGSGAGGIHVQLILIPVTKKKTAKIIASTNVVIFIVILNITKKCMLLV